MALILIKEIIILITFDIPNSVHIKLDLSDVM